MAITAQQQRIRLVDPRTGLIEREWINILNQNQDSIVADLAAAQAALVAAAAQIAALQASVADLAAQLSSLAGDELEDQVFQPTGVHAAIEVILQPASDDCVSEMVMQP